LSIWTRETIETLKGSVWRNVARKGNTFVANSARTKITIMHQTAIATNGTKLHGQQCQLASRDMKTIKRTFEEYISTPTGFDPVPDSTLDPAAVVAFDSAVVDTVVTTFDSVGGVAHCIPMDIEPAPFLVFVLRTCCFLKAIFAEGALLRTEEETGGIDPMRYLGACSPVEVRAVCFVRAMVKGESVKTT
jgi:hypothetical protein